MNKQDTLPPLLHYKAYTQASEFAPENLLREARRQRSVPDGRVPSVCVLDPDGDIVAHLVARGKHRGTLSGRVITPACIISAWITSSVGLSARLSERHLPC